MAVLAENEALVKIARCRRVAKHPPAILDSPSFRQSLMCRDQGREKKAPLLNNGFQTAQAFTVAHSVAASESASSGAVLRAGTTARDFSFAT